MTYCLLEILRAVLFSTIRWNAKNIAVLIADAFCFAWREIDIFSVWRSLIKNTVSGTPNPLRIRVL